MNYAYLNREFLTGLFTSHFTLHSILLAAFALVQLQASPEISNDAHGRQQRHTEFGFSAYWILRVRFSLPYSGTQRARLLGYIVKIHGC